MKSYPGVIVYQVTCKETDGFFTGAGSEVAFVCGSGGEQSWAVSVEMEGENAWEVPLVCRDVRC